MSKQYKVCPVCGLDCIEDSDYEIKENVLILEVFCMECDAVWYEVYEFIHNENEFGDILFD
jgi:hypothetical protein